MLFTRIERAKARSLSTVSPRQRRLLIYALALILSSVVSSRLVFAAEEGGEKKEGGEGEKKEGGESDREWAKRSSKINVLESKITEFNKEVREAIEAKNAGRELRDEKNNKIDVLTRISGSYKELVKTVDDYNKEKAVLKYRYPEEGALIDRKYVPMRVQSLDQIEKELGINGELSKTKKKIDQKYAPFIDQAPKPTAEQLGNGSRDKSTEHAKDKTGEDNSGRLKLSQ